MRLGVFSDVHGNLPALQAVLEQMAADDVTHYVCSGDLVGYGPQPNECVALLREIEVKCVAGNHDLIATGRLSDDGIGPLARQTLRWTTGALAAETRAYLSELPVTLKWQHMLITHGAIANPRVRIRNSREAAEQLVAMTSLDPALRFLILGHTHRPLVYSDQRAGGAVRSVHAVEMAGTGRYVLNPGAVGQARERRVRARCLIVDLDEGWASFRAVRYDLRACEHALRASGLPAGTYHLKPTPLPTRLRRRARSVWRARLPSGSV